MHARIAMTIAFTLMILPATNPAYPPPSVNPDWQEYPYCPGGCSHEYLKTEWAKYYDMKGAEWMEQKKLEMLSAYESDILYDWIDSDQSKANQNVFTYYFVAGEVPNHDGEYFDSVPSCKDAAGVSKSQICHVEDTPPCPEPSFQKHGLCVMEKESLCGKDTTYVDGVCLVNHPETSPSSEEKLSFQIYLLAVFSTIAALPISGTIYWRKNKRFRKIVLTFMVMSSVLLFLLLVSGMVPNAIA